MRVLYIEDEAVLADAVKYNLEKNGLIVDLANTGEEGLRMAASGIYDCLVLDIMLPDLSGIEILESLRKRAVKTPIILLSALSSVEDKVDGLNAGADDYLAKPFKTIELLARINAVTRRPTEIQGNVLKYLDLEFDSSEKRLNGEALTPKEATILEELLKTPGKIVKKEYLLKKVWGCDFMVEDNYLEVYISRLRKLLKKISSKANIKSVRKLGYKIF